MRVFQARPLPPTQVAEIVQEAWNIDRLAEHYQAFLARWQDPEAQAPDSLARDLLLESDWLRTIRDDPRLPREHLPAGWPAEPAQELFYALSAELKTAARTIAAGLLDTITDEQADER